MNPIRSHAGHRPSLGARVYVDPAATVIGEVELGDDVSVWPGAVIRGDVSLIRIGARTNVQDGTIIHVNDPSPEFPAGQSTRIGAQVTIGHGCIIHACTLGDLCLIGMGACVLDGAEVKKYGFVGAGALVTPGKVVGEAELWLGNPARFVRKLGDREIEGMRHSADHYVQLKDRYLAETGRDG